MATVSDILTSFLIKANFEFRDLAAMLDYNLSHTTNSYTHHKKSVETWLDYFVIYMTIGTRFDYEDGDQKRKGWHIENFPRVEERDEAWICNDHSSIGAAYHRYLLLWSQQHMEHLATRQYQFEFVSPVLHFAKGMLENSNLYEERCHIDFLLGL